MGRKGEERYAARSSEDFERLYEETYQRIFRTLVVITGDEAAAEDCTQEAYLKAFKAWKLWRGEAPAEAWLHRIAIHTAISHRRRQRIREAGELLRRLWRPVEPGLDDERSMPELEQALRQLPPRQAAAIVLRHLHGYSNREIAAVLRIPESTVASRLAEGKKTLRARLGAEQRRSMDASAPSGVSSSD